MLIISLLSKSAADGGEDGIRRPVLSRREARGEIGARLFRRIARNRRGGRASRLHPRPHRRALLPLLRRLQPPPPARPVRPPPPHPAPAAVHPGRASRLPQPPLAYRSDQHSS